MVTFFIVFWTSFCNHNFFPKSQKGNEIWTFLKMSKNENPKKVLKMTHFSLFDHTGHIFILKVAKFVTLIFQFFGRKL